MAFKLQLTDEMIGFFRTQSLQDVDAGRLIRLLIDASLEMPLPDQIPQPLTHVLQIFLGQIESFRAHYKQKAQNNADRQRRHREDLSSVGDVSRVTGVTERDGRYGNVSRVTGVTERDWRYSDVSRVTGVTERDRRYGDASRVTGVTERDRRYGNVSRVTGVTERDNACNAHTIPDQSNPSTLTGGGGACGTGDDPPPPQSKRLDGKPWSRDDYARLAISSGWPTEEVNRFCDMNNAGRLNPADALAAWARHRTPTEEAGGASAVSSRHRTENVSGMAMHRALDAFRTAIDESTDKRDFIASCMPNWLRDCPNVPPALRDAFRNEVTAIAAAYSEEATT
jgi:hypothetical protein